MANKKEKFMKIVNKIEDFLFEPHNCICCGRDMNQESSFRLCTRCEKEIPFTKDKFCLRCGEIVSGDYDYCITCKNRDYEFDYARSVFAYTSKTSPIIMKFKYNGCKTFAKPLANMLVDFYSRSDILANVVTYVPMPAKRLKQRGYNQSYELCREFSMMTGIPMIDVLERTFETNKQATLNASQRAENIKGQFKVINRDLVKNKEILIIDDVLTTGATANECAKVLNKAGAMNVCVLTLAKTPEKDIDWLDT